MARTSRRGYWQSSIPLIIKRMEGDATKSGLKAAAEFLKGKIVAFLEGGYTSGAWVTGRIAQSVQRSRPGRDRITVFTMNPIAAEWELGHFNLFLQQYIRVEVFRPLTEQHAHEVAQIFGERYLEKLTEIAHTKLAPALTAGVE
jgi:hypothetical protein